MKLFIVTGASKGLGQALLKRLMRPGNRLIGIARSDVSEELKDRADREGAALSWVCCDFGNTDDLEPAMDKALVGIRLDEFDTVCLINNAGVIEPIAPAAHASGADLARNLSVNLIAPVVLVASFLRHTASLGADRRVLNISSGAGKKPYAGWSAYCASKAGLDMFTRCVGEEEAAGTGGAHVLSVAPGVVDTDMQRDIRGSAADLFPSRDRFVALKETGQLAGTDETAERLLQVLFDDRFPSGSVLDVRDLF